VVPGERLATLVGRADEAIFKDLASEMSLSAEQSAELLRHKNAFYESSESALHPIPGALDFVHWSHPALSTCPRDIGISPISALPYEDLRSRIPL
jgi:hypothetical protein